MKTPDSPTPSLAILGQAIERSRKTAIGLNIGSGVFFVGWIAALFIHPLPVLGWIALTFFALAHLYQMGRGWIDHHAAMTHLIPLEFQIVSAQAISAAQERDLHVSHPESIRASSKAASGAVGLTGNKVN